MGVNYINTPMISVIVPVYNKESTICKCVDSILSQTYQNIEIILIDDGSKDKSLEVCLELQRKSHKVSVYSQDNKGVSAARNLGIKKSRGSILSFVDADDVLHGSMLERLMSQMDADIDIISCCCYAVTEEGNTPQYFFRESFTAEDFEQKKMLYFQLLDTGYGQVQEKIYTGIGVPWAKLYRKKLFKENDLWFDERISHLEDNILNYELFILAKKVKYINEPLYYYSTDHIQTVLRAYSQKVVNSYCITSVLRYKLAAKHGMLGNHKFKEKLDKETINLLNIAIIKLLFDQRRKVSYNDVILELRYINEEIGIKDVLAQISFQSIHSPTAKALYKFLKERKYKLAYLVLKARGILRK